MKRVYLAGPMSGFADLNFPLFHRMAGELRALGYSVINPAEINVDPTADWHECMRKDIAELVTCDAIVLLDGWSRSRGASFEHLVALTLGMEVFSISEALGCASNIADAYRRKVTA